MAFVNLLLAAFVAGCCACPDSRRVGICCEGYALCAGAAPTDADWSRCETLRLTCDDAMWGPC